MIIGYGCVMQMKDLLNILVYCLVMGLGLADSSGFRFLVDATDIGNLGWSNLLLGWCLADAVR